VTQPILLVRLKSRLPGGATVGESRRVCHLVPVPETGEVPPVLRAHCGATIAPGTADVLPTLSGMPCEPCLAGSRLPAFAMLRAALINGGSAGHIDSAPIG
jgi:hypothetical protein